MNYHYPAQRDLVAKFLLETGGDRFIDCTAGSGGHIQALLEKASGPVKVLAIDIDPYAVTRLKSRFNNYSNVTIVQGDFRYLERIAGEQRFLPVDGILADLGQASEQLEDPNRGFSYERDGPLDMRYNPYSTITAADIVNNWTKNDLVRLFRQVGGERKALMIAKGIMANRPIYTTNDLRKIIERVAGQNFIFKTLSRIFMALRVAVNNELEAIRDLLLSVPALLSPGGRMVVLSYDGNQDRLVKAIFHRLAHPCICPPDIPHCVCGRKSLVKILTQRPLLPGEDETYLHPSVRSSRMRVIERLRES